MRLSIRDYAAREGISEITVRRRIKRGELVAEQVPTAQGFTYEIVVDDDTDEEPAAPDADHEGGHDQSPPDQATRQELITELRGQIDYLKQEIEDRKREHDSDRADWRNELDRLHTLMAQQGQTLQALTQTVESLPAQVAEARLDPADTPSAETAASDPHKWLSTVGSVVTIVVAVLATIRGYREGFDQARDITQYTLIALQWITLYGQLFFMQKKNRAADDGDKVQRDRFATWQDRSGMVNLVALLGVLGVSFLW